MEGACSDCDELKNWAERFVHEKYEQPEKIEETNAKIVSMAGTIARMKTPNFQIEGRPDVVLDDEFSGDESDTITSPSKRVDNLSGDAALSDEVMAQIQNRDEAHEKACARLRDAVDKFIACNIPNLVAYRYDALRLSAEQLKHTKHNMVKFLGQVYP